MKSGLKGDFLAKIRGRQKTRKALKDGRKGNSVAFIQAGKLMKAGLEGLRHKCHGNRSNQYLNQVCD